MDGCSASAAASWIRCATPSCRRTAGAYPALAERLEYIRKTIRTEEERFGQTIDAGLGILEKMLEHVSGGTLDGASIFRLYDTFGLPAGPDERNHR